MDNQNDNNFDQNSNRHPIGHVSRNTINNKDIFMSFISRKAEQLTTAVYLITDIIDETDPLRRYTRKCSVALLGVACELRSSSAQDRSEIMLDLDALFADLHTYISTSKSIGLITDMNADILLTEIDKGRRAIVTFRESEMKLYKKREEGMVASYLLDQVFAGSEELDLKDTKDPQVNTKNIQNDTPALLSDTKTSPDQKPVEERKVITNKNDIALKLLRRKTIIGIIKDKKEVSLNDIKKVINDVSEKTLQREIMSLIEEGIVDKKGEKRWARYTLKDQK